MSLMDIQGRARRVPPPEDPIEWTRFTAWLERDTRAERDDVTGAVVITTPAAERLSAQPGDWVIMAHSGALYVGRVQCPLALP